MQEDFWSMCTHFIAKPKRPIKFQKEETQLEYQLEPGSANPMEIMVAKATWEFSVHSDHQHNSERAWF